MPAVDRSPEAATTKADYHHKIREEMKTKAGITRDHQNSPTSHRFPGLTKETDHHHHKT
jgi:hypothetical protein